MLKQTKNFLAWQKENCKAKLTPEQKRKARFNALLLKRELEKIIDAKYRAELEADSDCSSSTYELSGNLSFGSNYFGDDEAPTGSIGSYGDVDMDGFQVVDTEDLSDDEEGEEYNG